MATNWRNYRGLPLIAICFFLHICTFNQHYFGKKISKIDLDVVAHNTDFSPNFIINVSVIPRNLSQHCYPKLTKPFTDISRKVQVAVV
jgi:hypothetical protein